MCGIVGYIGERKAVPIILDGLRRLEYRGYDSAGLAVYSDEKTLEVLRTRIAIARATSWWCTTAS